MEVSVLVENTSKGNLKGEHGLSFHIKHKNKNYLIDSGKSALFLKNAEDMGIDVGEVDVAFLSHAHYDHSGGFEEFFNVNTSANVYLQKACKEKYYYKIIGPLKKYIGIPKGLLNDYADRFVYSDGYESFQDNVFICPHTSKDLTLIGKRTNMYSKINNEFLFDDFSHEQTVVFEENNNLHLFNSCSHGGVANIIDEIKEYFPDKHIKSFFGGFHMVGATGVNSCNFSQDEIRHVGETLLESSDAIFYTGHCTGSIAFNWLKEVMGDRLVQLHTGMVVTL